MLVCLFLFFSNSLLANDDTQKHFMWEVRSDQATVYMLGSIHMLPDDAYPLDSAIETIFDQAHIAVFEADLDSLALAMQSPLLMQKAIYPAGKTLRSELTVSSYQYIADELKKLDLSVDDFQQFQPWFLALTITMVELQKQNINSESGIDQYFYSKAKGVKKIIGLESPNYQLKMLLQFAEIDQDLFFRYSMEDIKMLVSEFDQMYQSWSTGNVKAMDELVTKSLADYPELMPVFDKLLYERNQQMAAKIDQFLKADEVYFVVIGAAHFGGELGILNLLKEKGYQIEQR